MSKEYLIWPCHKAHLHVKDHPAWDSRGKAKFMTTLRYTKSCHKFCVPFLAVLILCHRLVKLPMKLRLHRDSTLFVFIGLKKKILQLDLFFTTFLLLAAAASPPCVFTHSWLALCACFGSSLPIDYEVLQPKIQVL